MTNPPVSSRSRRALITAGTYDQVWRIWRTKSVNDISASYVLMAGVNEVTWLNYGVASANGR
jgi:uncharacterized protein with PQ loop repeat